MLALFLCTSSLVLLATAIPAPPRILEGENKQVGVPASQTFDQAPTSLAIFLPEQPSSLNKRQLNKILKGKTATKKKTTTTKETTSTSVQKASNTATAAAVATASPTKTNGKASASKTASEAASSSACPNNTKGKQNAGPQVGLYGVLSDRKYFDQAVKQAEEIFKEPENRCDNSRIFEDPSKKPQYFYVIATDKVKRRLEKLPGKPKVIEQKNFNYETRDVVSNVSTTEIPSKNGTNTKVKGRGHFLSQVDGNFSTGHTLSPRKVRMTSKPTSSWNLARISDGQDTPLNSNSNWQYWYPKSGGAGVDIYHIDASVGHPHSQIAGRVEHTRSQYTSDAYTVDLEPTDPYWIPYHATYGAVLAAGTDYGVAPKATVISVKAMKPTTANVPGAYTRWIGDNDVYALSLITAFHEVLRLYARRRRPAVVNLSLRVPNDAIVLREARAIVDAGISLVISAGNDGGDMRYIHAGRTDYGGIPHDIGQINVGASMNNDAVLPESNWGDAVHLYAPGYEVITGDRAGGSGTTVVSGTSYAAPHVSAVIALMLGENSRLTPGQIRQKLLNAAGDVYVTTLGLWFKKLLQMDGLW